MAVSAGSTILLFFKGNGYTFRTVIILNWFASLLKKVFCSKRNKFANFFLLTLVILNKLRCHTFQIFDRSDYLIQVVDTKSHIELQTVQIQISWLLQKPIDLDLHCLQRQGIFGFSRTGVKDDPFSEGDWLCRKTKWSQRFVSLTVEKLAENPVPMLSTSFFERSFCLAEMKNMICDWQYLIRNHLSFLCLVFKYYHKTNSMAKNWKLVWPVQFL